MMVAPALGQALIDLIVEQRLAQKRGQGLYHRQVNALSLTSPTPVFQSG